MQDSRLVTATAVETTAEARTDVGATENRKTKRRRVLKSILEDSRQGAQKYVKAYNVRRGAE